MASGHQGCPECGSNDGVPRYNDDGVPCPVCGTERDFNNALMGKPPRRSVSEKCTSTPTGNPSDCPYMHKGFCSVCGIQNS